MNQASVSCAQDPKSLREMHEMHEQWGPSWIGEEDGIFSALLICGSSQCRQPVAVGGVQTYRINEGDAEHGQFVEFFQAKTFYPPLVLLDPPARVPAPVVEAIDKASGVLWLSAGAAGNLLRQAVEALLTAKRVRKTSPKNGRRLDLHQRLDEYKKRDPEMADVLMAVKWIGNVGSHKDALSIDDVLLGAEILGLALHNLYDKRDAELLRSARRIVKSKGKRISS